MSREYSSLERKLLDPIEGRVSRNKTEKITPEFITGLKEITQERVLVTMGKGDPALNIEDLMNGKDILVIEFRSPDGNLLEQAQIENKYMGYRDRGGKRESHCMPFLFKDGVYSRLRDKDKIFGDYATELPLNSGSHFSSTAIDNCDPDNKKIDGGDLPQYLRQVESEFKSLVPFVPGISLDMEGAKKLPPRIVGYIMSRILNEIIIPRGYTDPSYFAGDGCNVPNIDFITALKINTQIESFMKQITCELELETQPIIRMVCIAGYPTENQFQSVNLTDQDRRPCEANHKSALEKLQEKIVQIVGDACQSALKDWESRNNGTFLPGNNVLMGINQTLYLAMRENYSKQLTVLQQAGHTYETISQLQRLVDNLSDYLRPKSLPLVYGSSKTPVEGGNYQMYFVTNPQILESQITKLDSVFNYLLERLNKYSVS